MQWRQRWRGLTPSEGTSSFRQDILEFIADDLDADAQLTDTQSAVKGVKHSLERGRALREGQAELLQNAADSVDAG